VEPTGSLQQKEADHALIRNGGSRHRRTRRTNALRRDGHDL
ncbi:MAG: hypothetical protein AVDCRST_MAG23-2325, partial [uncultured Sphingosinicella sp.]